MLASHLIVLFSIAVALSVLATLKVTSQPEASFLFSLFAILIFIVTAYYSNWIEIYDVYVTNTTSAVRTVSYNVLGIPTITRDTGLQWLSLFGLIYNTVILWLSSSAYGGAR